MAKVTFVQIGNSSMPKQTYTDKLNLALNQYPGAIIFGTYYDNDKKKECQEIWANGKQYSVGAGSDAKFYDSSLTPEAYFVAHPDDTPLHGDYYIKTSDLNGNTSDNIEERTAYVYDSVNKVWVALSGNYDANNVYFPQGIDRTEAWGVAGATTDVSSEECKNKNLKELLEHYLVKEQFPTTNGTTSSKTIPEWSISSNTKPTLSVLQKENGNTATSGQIVEVGTTFYVDTVEYNTTVTAYQGTTQVYDGSTKSYSLGPSTINGMKYGFWSKADHDGNKMDAEHLVKLESVTFNGTTVTDASSHSYTPNDTRVTATGTYKYNKSEESEMSYSIIGFTQGSGNSNSSTDTGDSSLKLTGRTITVTEGSNSIQLLTKNANYWTRSVDDNNVIPATNKLYLATNKDGHVDFSGHEKDVSVGSVTVDKGTASRKVENSNATSGGEFTATGVYPIYHQSSKYPLTKVHSGDIVYTGTVTSAASERHILTKETGVNVAWCFKYPSKLGTAKIQVVSTGEWKDINMSVVTITSETINGLAYTVVNVNPTDAQGTAYRIYSLS